jgi:hypothetical protein
MRPFTVLEVDGMINENHYVIALRSNTEVRYLKSVLGTRGEYTSEISEACVFTKDSDMERARNYVQRDMDFGGSSLGILATFEETPKVIPMKLNYLLTPLVETEELKTGYGDTAKGDPIPRHITTPKEEL